MTEVFAFKLLTWLHSWHSSIRCGDSYCKEKSEVLFVGGFCWPDTRSVEQKRKKIVDKGEEMDRDCAKWFMFVLWLRLNLI